MKQKSVRRIVNLVVIIAILSAFSALILTEGIGPAKELEELLHGSQKIKISKFEIGVGYGSGLQKVVITDQGDLDFLSAAFRKAATNPAGLGKGYGATIYFGDNRQVRAEIVIRDDMEYLVVFVPTFMQISDPEMFQVSLSPLLPTGLSNTLHSIVVK